MATVTTLPDRDAPACAAPPGAEADRAPQAGRSPRPRPLALARRFLRSTRATAALEFMLIAPFLITLLLGAFEITRYVKTSRHINYLASSIGEFFAQNTTGSVSDNDLHFAIDSTMVVFPDSMANATRKGIVWWQDIAVTMSSVAFTPTVAGCSSNCTYSAKLTWTSGSATRPCGIPLLPASDTAVPMPATLPTDVYGPGSLIVIDIVYNYTPLVATNLFGTMKITRSFYVQPRYVTAVTYTPTAAPMGYNCPAT